ncbi:MAG TPA: hypothetical protein VF598_07675, partial [Hymenobacter sp.]
GFSLRFQAEKLGIRVLLVGCWLWQQCATLDLRCLRHPYQSSGSFPKLPLLLSGASKPCGKPAFYRRTKT